jgi:hypothetical protein
MIILIEIIVGLGVTVAIFDFLFKICEGIYKTTIDILPDASIGESKGLASIEVFNPFATLDKNKTQPNPKAIIQETPILTGDEKIKRSLAFAIFKANCNDCTDEQVLEKWKAARKRNEEKSK